LQGQLQYIPCILYLRIPFFSFLYIFLLIFFVR
jgi:hypothetical protein